MSLELPNSIRIGPYTFDVNERDEKWHRTHNDYGSMILEDLMINVVTEDRPAMFVLDTLVHEINHGIWSVWNLNDNDSEERVVAVMATGWLAVLRDNPDLLALIQATVGPAKRKGGA